MKLLSYIATLSLMLGAQSALGCDEQCKKEAASAKHSTQFPGYLSWKYCDGLKSDFVTIDLKSLQSYSGKHFNTKYKGPIKNTVKFLKQRKSWLEECDNYNRLTREERIFHDDKTTVAVFTQIDKINQELEAILGGVTYTSSRGDQTKEIVAGKFENLYKVVDDHANLMHLKGKYVYQ